MNTKPDIFHCELLKNNSDKYEMIVRNLLTVWRGRLLVVSAVRRSGFRLPLTVALIDVGGAATKGMTERAHTN